MIRHFSRGYVLSLTHKSPTTTSLCPFSTPSSFPLLRSPLLSRHFATFQIVVPNLGDSITEGTIAELTKNKGDDVSTDEVIARLETDKVSIDVRSTGSGKINAVNVKQGDTVHVGDVLFEGDDAGGGGGGQPAAAASKDSASTPSGESQTKQQPVQPEPTPTKTQAIDSAHTQPQQQHQQQQPQQQQQQQAAHSPEDDSQPHHAHHPLIQFRHGRRPNHSNPPTQPTDARKQPRQVPASSLTNQPAPAQQQSTLLRGLQPDSYFNQDDFTRGNEAAASARQQLPAYYRRKVWSEAEQEAVMMGGAPAYVPKALQKEKEKTAAGGGKKK